MARIRSIHPGQWRDEDFVELSSNARLLTLALRNLADDRGVFEWKPKSLKMEVFPADNIDVEALLAELVAHRQVKQYEADGKTFGAIRNFRKWQRPEKPKFVHPFDDALASYVGLSTTTPPSEAASVADQSALPVGDPSANSKSEEGGRRKEEGGKSTPPANAGGGDAPLLALTPRPPDDPPDHLQSAVDLWNGQCCPPLAKVEKMTDKRRKELRARLKEHFADNPIAGWTAYLQRIIASDFLAGRNRRPGERAWKADFDFAISASGCVKVLEGKYDNPPDSGREVRRPPIFKVAEGTI